MKNDDKFEMSDPPKPTPSGWKLISDPRTLAVMACSLVLLVFAIVWMAQ